MLPSRGALLLLAPLLACTGDAETGDDAPVDCRALLTQGDCMAAEAFELDDGRTGSCRWFDAQLTTRSGDSCSSGGSRGLCLAAGPTLPSCTYTPMEEAYPSCAGTPAATTVPDLWVEDGDELLLISGVCGPSLADPMGGRCGADPAGEPAECLCACL